MSFLRFLAEYRTDSLNLFFLGITALAQEFFVIGVVCWLYWCGNKRLGRTLGFSFFASGLLVQGLKITFRIPRPWVLDPTFEPVAKAVPAATGYSFPSGHTQSITSLFATLGFHFRKRRNRILSYIMIFLVGMSRMYLGVHTPKDVLTSFLVSFVIAGLCYRFTYAQDPTIKDETSKKNPAKEDGCSSPMIRALLLIGASLVLLVYALVMYHRQVIELAYAADCIKASGAGIAFGIGYYIEETRIHFTVPPTWKAKILRFLLGVIIAVLLLEGIKPIVGTSLAASFFRYFIAVLWVVALYPAVFNRIK
ncbi:MAG: phosphatase PAP2 family protein [Eubacteriales bacterium]|nr:phosphatase PAP2 family protein [Eubacteriales bacterium]